MPPAGFGVLSESASLAGGVRTSGGPGASSRSGDGGSVAIAESRSGSGGEGRGGAIGRRERAPEDRGSLRLGREEARGFPRRVPAEARGGRP